MGLQIAASERSEATRLRTVGIPRCYREARPIEGRSERA
jgi:hypothetical protein